MDGPFLVEGLFGFEVLLLEPCPVLEAAPAVEGASFSLFILGSLCASVASPLNASRDVTRRLPKHRITESRGVAAQGRVFLSQHLA